MKLHQLCLYTHYDVSFQEGAEVSWWRTEVKTQAPQDLEQGYRVCSQIQKRTKDQRQKQIRRTNRCFLTCAALMPLFWKGGTQSSQRKIGKLLREGQVRVEKLVIRVVI